ncbi:MAG TPA: hypothetical protein VEH31_10435, partial [Streptosporangiaceae bacterium]|nr:hypothetical protein [Streptosporangiaceae bacterium]
MTGPSFPRLTSRDLDGREVMLPAGLPGEWNVIVVAFRRQQQELADSWMLSHQELRQLGQAPDGKRQAMAGRPGLGDLLDLPPLRQRELRRVAAFVPRIQRIEPV